jgi:hypothetical protein
VSTDGASAPIELAPYRQRYYGPSPYLNIGAESLFQSTLPELGVTLMRTDGTVQGTVAHQDFFTRPNGYLYSDFITTNDKIFLPAWTEETGDELFVMDVQSPRPAATSILPTSGPSSGGTELTVTGSHLAPGLHFTIGGLRVTNEEVTSETSATMTTTAMPPGRLLDLTIHDAGVEDEEMTIDAQLVRTAKVLQARLLTNDSALCQVARLQQVPVLNLNDLARALSPTVVPGDVLELNLVKEGCEPHQAVGYLPDGTMIVINHGRPQLGRVATVVVSSSLQTAGGRLIFAELKENLRAGATSTAGTAS